MAIARRTGRLLVALAAAVVAVGLTISRLSAGGAPPCMPDDEVANNALTILLTAPDLASLRDSSGLGQVNPANLQVLTSNSTCNNLTKAIKDDYDIQGGNSAFVATYYAVDDRFLAYIVPRDNPPEAGNPAIILVFDDQLNELGTLIF